MPSHSDWSKTCRNDAAEGPAIQQNRLILGRQLGGLASIGVARGLKAPAPNRLRYRVPTLGPLRLQASATIPGRSAKASVTSAWALSSPAAQFNTSDTAANKNPTPVRENQPG